MSSRLRRRVADVGEVAVDHGARDGAVGGDVRGQDGTPARIASQFTAPVRAHRGGRRLQALAYARHRQRCEILRRIAAELD